MLNAIKYNLSNLTNFEGRDARQTFWYYVLMIVVVQYAIQIIASIPMYVSMFGGMFRAIRDNPGDPNAGAAAVEGMMADMMGSIQTLMIVTTIVGVISVGLLTASFVRRLHDAGFTGWIAVIPIAFYLGALGYNFVFFDQMEEIMRDAMVAGMEGGGSNPIAMQAEMGVMGLVGWIAPIVGIIFGAWPSTDGPNKYGTEPVRF